MQDATSSFAVVNSQVSFHTDLSSIFSQSCPFLIQYASSTTFLNWAVTEDAGIEPRTLAEFALTVRVDNIQLHLTTR